MKVNSRSKLFRFTHVDFKALQSVGLEWFLLFFYFILSLFLYYYPNNNDKKSMNKFYGRYIYRLCVFLLLFLCEIGVIFYLDYKTRL